jgi:dienelactone hydrolase
VRAAGMVGCMSIRMEPLEYAEGETRFIGQLAWDEAASGSRPGVVIFHEMGGVGDHVKYRAKLLAELGYVALACDMFGEGLVGREKTGPIFMELRGDRPRVRARARAGLRALLAARHVDSSRILAIGFCFGGLAALELARDGAELRAVVSFHGALETPMPAEPGAVRARVLACHGALDPHVTLEHVKRFSEEMNAAKCDWQLNVYGGAVHGFTNPDADKLGIPGLQYHAATDARAWRAMREFFAETLGVPVRG